MINPWWAYHCAGALDKKNDPYSDGYENPFTGISPWVFIFSILIVIVYTIPYGFGTKFLMTSLLKCEEWWAVGLFLALFIVLLLVYAMAIILTIKGMFKLMDRKKKK